MSLCSRPRAFPGESPIKRRDNAAIFIFLSMGLLANAHTTVLTAFCMATTRTPNPPPGCCLLTGCGVVAPAPGLRQFLAQHLCSVAPVRRSANPCSAAPTETSNPGLVDALHTVRLCAGWLSLGQHSAPFTTVGTVDAGVTLCVRVLARAVPPPSHDSGCCGEL